MMEVRFVGLEGFAVAVSPLMSRLAVCSLVTVSYAWAQPPASPAAGQTDLKNRVARLIELLDADQRTERIRAERALRSMGPEILKLLPPPELVRNESARVILRQLRIELERRRAQQSVTASRVSLSGKYTVAEVLTAVADQTGNRVDVSSLKSSQLHQVVSYPAQQSLRAFWPVLDDLSRRFGWKAVSGSSGSQAVRLVVSPPKPVPVVYSGPVRVQLVRSVIQPLLGVPGADKLRCNLELFVEPRLRPLFLRVSGKSIRAQAATGAMYPVLSLSGASLELPLGQDGRRIPFHVDFTRPQASTASRFSLTGSLSLQLAAAEAEFRFGQLRTANNVARRRNGVTVVLRRAAFETLADNTVTARVTVSIVYDAGGPAFESHRTWVFHNDAYLVRDGQRQRTSGSGFQIERQTNGGVQLTYSFRGLQQPVDDYRFVYEAPTLITNVPVNFHFERVPLRKQPE